MPGLAPGKRVQAMQVSLRPYGRWPDQELRFAFVLFTFLRFVRKDLRFHLSASVSFDPRRR